MDLSREIELMKQVGADISDHSDLEDQLEHGLIVSTIAGLVAAELGETDQFVEEIQKAGMLHDIGKLKLSSILYGRDDEILDVETVKYVRMHPALGNEVLREAGGYSEEVIDYIANHHENYDGTGYPNHIGGEEIPYGARIIRVCDVFSALVSNRPYREAFSNEAALEEMIEEVRNYDMRVFLAFMTVVHSPEFHEVEQMIEKAKRHQKFRRRAKETT